jgi:hypothetical protein
MSYVSNLQSAWDRYRIMDGIDVIQVTNPAAAAYEPDFAQAISIIRNARMFGFADYTGSAAFPNNGNNKFIGLSRG